MVRTCILVATIFMSLACITVPTSDAAPTIRNARDEPNNRNQPKPKKTMPITENYCEKYSRNKCTKDGSVDLDCFTAVFMNCCSKSEKICN